ncbi:uncharacterized protein DNG_07848 [Cephalotrichum gorgonifer]|uniref:Uncharacterized protein n=1 Tax=Cephalotrichum gorgonifer TaxID=2041049 RepID=A0AAE8SYM2_9PEZI|nr:uncharacterized protein DNG_07848 [Cephalotrichum gorgonifer]
MDRTSMDLSSIDRSIDRIGQQPSGEYDMGRNFPVGEAAAQLFYAIQDHRYSGPPPPRRSAVAQLVLHTFAFTGGLVGLIGVILQTAAPSEHAYFLILGYIAAIWVMIQNLFEMASLSFALRRTKPTPRLSPAWRIVQHIIVIGITAGGGALAPRVWNYTWRGSWAGTDDFCKVSMGGLFTAMSFHSILLMWALVDSIPQRRRSVALH